MQFEFNSKTHLNGIFKSERYDAPLIRFEYRLLDWGDSIRIGPHQTRRQTTVFGEKLFDIRMSSVSVNSLNCV